MNSVTQYFDFPNKIQFDQTIINAEKPPFPEPPASRNLENNPAEFMIGRRKEFEQLNQLYEQVVKSREPKLSFIQGAQGVGKSTLASNFVNEKLKNGQHLYLVPFETSGSEGGLQFVKFYELMINSLFKRKSIHELGYKLTSKLLKLLEEEFREEFDQLLLKLKIDRHQYNNILFDPSSLKKIDNSQFLPALIDQFQLKFNRFYDKLPSMDPELYLTLWYSIFPNPRPFDAIRALKGVGEFEGFNIDSDSKAKETFIELRN